VRVIVAGGRDKHLSSNNKTMLLEFVTKGIITELVCGMASGIDLEAYSLLKDYVSIKEFPANWYDLDTRPCKIKVNSRGKRYNALAGFNRNKLMAEYADGVILFDGGNGTSNMYQLSLEYDLNILYNISDGGQY